MALFGGVALYLVAHIAFRLRNVRSLNRQRLIAAGITLALVPAGLVLPAIASLSAVTFVLVVLVAYEVVHFKEARHAIRDHEGNVQPGESRSARRTSASSTVRRPAARSASTLVESSEAGAWSAKPSRASSSLNR